MKRISPNENGSAVIRKEMIDNIKILGEGHPETIRSQQKLALQLYREGQWEECLKYSLMSMDKFERDIENILKDGKKGSYQKASTTSKEYEEISNIVLSVYERSMDYMQERIKTVERVLLTFKQIFGQQSQQYAQQLQKKSKILFEKGDKTGSMTCLEECIATQKQLLTEFHGDFSETYKITGLVLSEYGLFSEGILYCVAALQVLDKQIQQYQQMQQQQLQYGGSMIQLSPYTMQQCQQESAHIKIIIATILRKQNKFNQAIEILFEALKQQQHPSPQQKEQYLPHLSNDSKYYLLCLNELSLNLRDCGRLDQALEFAQKCLQLKIDTKNNTYEESENLSIIYYLKGDLLKSKEIMTKILPQAVQFHEFDPDNKKRLKKLIDLLGKLVNISQILGDSNQVHRHQQFISKILTKVSFKRKKNSQGQLSFSQSSTHIYLNASSRYYMPSQQSLRSTTMNHHQIPSIKKNYESLHSKTEEFSQSNISFNKNKSIIHLNQGQNQKESNKFIHTQPYFKDSVPKKHYSVQFEFKPSSSPKQKKPSLSFSSLSKRLSLSNLESKDIKKNNTHPYF